MDNTWAGPFGVFVTRFRYPVDLMEAVPFYERGLTREAEEPFREGVSHVFRLGRKGLAVGVGHWRRPSDVNPDEALLSAAEGHVQDVAVAEIEEWRRPELPEAEMIEDAWNFEEFTESPHLANIAKERHARERQTA